MGFPNGVRTKQVLSKQEELENSDIRFRVSELLVGPGPKFGVNANHKLQNENSKLKS